MNIDDIYVSFWGKQKPKFTEMELALMEGGHSLETKQPSMQFIKELKELQEKRNENI